MKMTKLERGMLRVIIPVITLAMIGIIVAAFVTGRQMVYELTGNLLEVTLLKEQNMVDSYLREVKAQADMLANVVETTQQEMELEGYVPILMSTIEENDFIIASGVWYEPYYYNGEEYASTYVYKGDTGIEVTGEYNTKEYDYPSQTFYEQVKQAEETILTQIFFDEVSGTIMLSCSAPIMVDGRFVGCVAFDLDGESVKKSLDTMELSTGGDTVLIGEEGEYLGGTYGEAAKFGIKVTLSPNESFLRAVDTILADDSTGTTSYNKEDGEYKVFYTTLKECGWKLFIELPTKTFSERVYSLVLILSVIGIVVTLITAVILAILMKRLAKRIDRVKDFICVLGEGDFTIEPVVITRKDEIAVMGQSLNGM